MMTHRMASNFVTVEMPRVMTLLIPFDSTVTCNGVPGTMGEIGDIFVATFVIGCLVVGTC